MLYQPSQLRPAYPSAEHRVHLAFGRQAVSHKPSGSRRHRTDHATDGEDLASWEIGDPIPAALLQIASVISFGIVLPIMLFTALYPSNWPALLAAFCTVVVCLASLHSQREELAPADTTIAAESTATRQQHQRRALTAGVTHELRTPLTILKGRLHAIEDGVILPDDGETARLLRQVEHVLRIVEDFDLLSQDENSAPTLRRQKVGLGEAVAAVVSDLRALFERHDIAITETYDHDAVIHADPARLIQIATNLITNAAKHSPIGGRILIDVERRGGHAWLSVRDEGPGFAPADRQHMFAPFWRSKASVERPGCFGTGMGLALTAGLVEAHRGRIVAENRSDRSGACFKVGFPIS